MVFTNVLGKWCTQLTLLQCDLLKTELCIIKDASSSNFFSLSFFQVHFAKIQTYLVSTTTPQLNYLVKIEMLKKSQFLPLVKCHHFMM